MLSMKQFQKIRFFPLDHFQCLVESAPWFKPRIEHLTEDDKKEEDEEEEEETGQKPMLATYETSNVELLNIPCFCTFSLAHLASGSRPTTRPVTPSAPSI